MNLLLNKLVNNNTSTKIEAKKQDSGFIPYVCHYNPNTILTKNGELLQVIRITGFKNDSIISEMIALRDAVRDSIASNVKDNKVAFWFHTIRRRKNIVPRGEFHDFFSSEVNKKWNENYKWNDQYVNELYITIIVEGLDTSIVNFNAFLRSFSYFTTRSLHKKYLEESYKKLSKIVTSILVDIEEYGAKLLGIKEWDGILYSEPMRFFGKIINLYEDRYPLAVNDISEDLVSHKIAFGNRELEVIGYNHKNFAAMLSLKEYQETPLSSLDKILQSPFEFIISQSFDFTFSKKEFEAYEYQNHILEVSGDEDFRHVSGAANFIESNTGSPNDYGKLQTTIMFINKTLDGLEKDIKDASEKFASLGLVVVREDLFSEHCFWSQLPGNFKFLRRQKIINTYRLGGFATLQSFPTGLIDGNRWGPAITVLQTILGTPYFFNFHDHDVGHSLILGPDSSGKTVFTNFMLTQGRRFDNKIFYFDLESSSKCFIKALSGQYYKASVDNNDAEFLHMNLFSLLENEGNAEVLKSWITGLVAFKKDLIPQSEIDLIPQVVSKIIAAKPANIHGIIDAFNAPETRAIYTKLVDLNKDKLFNIFTSGHEINWNDKIISFDLSAIAKQKSLLSAAVIYLLHKIELTLDGSPAVIVLQDAWKLIDNPVFAPQIDDFLNRMRQKNTIVIFIASEVGQTESDNLFTNIKKNIACEILMPNPQPSEYYKTILGLNDEEINIVQVMEVAQRHFLFKHRGDTVITSLDLSKFLEIAQVLSSHQMTITAMEEVIATNRGADGKDPKIEVWLTQLFEILKELEKERQEQEKKEMIAARLAEKKRKELLED